MDIGAVDDGGLGTIGEVSQCTHTPASGGEVGRVNGERLGTVGEIPQCTHTSQQGCVGIGVDIDGVDNGGLSASVHAHDR